jgi:hypothetical protein
VGGVGRDEAESFATTSRDFRSGFAPPKHEVVGEVGNVAFSVFAQDCGMTDAESIAHPLDSNEGRIPKDVIP